MPLLPDLPELPEVAPQPISTRRLVAVGICCWAIALGVTAVVPGLHTGARSWWPMACLAGIVLGLIGYRWVARSEDAGAS